MCFSPSVSFIAGVSLAAIGALTLKRVTRKREIPFALIPLLFGIQQLIEGLLWLSFRFDAPLLNAATTYAFSVFSHSVWPIFVPFSVGLLEVVPWRRHVIFAFQIIGLGIGLYLLYFIVRYPITAVAGEHIVYVSPHFSQTPAMLLYLAATCVVSFFSSHRLVKVFGASALALFFVAYWFYTAALFSVWCFSRRCSARSSTCMSGPMAFGWRGHRQHKVRKTFPRPRAPLRRRAAALYP